jgi:formamidopyrimidine-DNA glycosylase
MPELPEVETTRRGLERFVVGAQIRDLIVRNPHLRWPVSRSIARHVRGQQIKAINRRAKYLLIDCGTGNLLLHLGMSGSLRVLDQGAAAQKHDHIDLVLGNGKLVRFTDPRRFGSLHWTGTEPEQHPLLAQLGVEPLSAQFNAQWLHDATRGRSASIKHFLMDAHQVVGIGNIYASEALFLAAIDPRLCAGRLSLPRAGHVVSAVKDTLHEALAAGGSSLRNYRHSDGELGNFQLRCNVYARAGEACRRCEGTVRALRQGQRSTFFCPRCQRR